MSVVYISFAPAEASFAQVYVRQLEQAGLDVLSRLTLSEQTPERIEAAIRACNAVVYLRSPAAGESAEVQLELGLARRLSKAIIEVDVQPEFRGAGIFGDVISMIPSRMPQEVARQVRDLPGADATPDGEVRVRGITSPTSGRDEEIAQVAEEAEEPAPAPADADDTLTSARVPPAPPPQPQPPPLAPSGTYPVFPPLGSLGASAPAPGRARAGEAAKAAAAETLQFSAYHANTLAVEQWNTLLVYAAAGDALAAVAADAATFTELGSAPRTSTGQSSRAVAQGAELTIEPHLEGVSFSPPSDTFIWRGGWHRALFRFQAASALAGGERTGWVDIYAGPMVPIARIDLTFTFTAPRTALGNKPPAGRTVTSNPHDTVFISYSHRDREAFRQACEEYARFGITVFTDDHLPAGADYEHDLAHMIAAARVFHLLWSPTSAGSVECKKEWTAALLREPTERFIKPWYWHQPLTAPPPELAQHHISFRFQRLRRKLWKPETWR